MALLWWRYLWPRSFMARRQGERPLGGGANAAWKRIAYVVVIGLSMQVVISYLCDGVLSLLPEVAADYSELVEETGLGDTNLLAVLTTVLGAPFCEELLVRGIVFEFSLRAFNPQCRPLWKRRRRASAQKGAIELSYEVTLKQDDTAFITELSEMDGVASAVLVSYNGDYMG